MIITDVAMAECNDDICSVTALHDLKCIHSFINVTLLYQQQQQQRQQYQNVQNIYVLASANEAQRIAKSLKI